jgi:hypothetical protein
MSDRLSESSSAIEHSARLLYALYTALAREFMIDLPPCDELETSAATSQHSLAEAGKWFLSADERIPVHQLRQFLQTSSLAGQESLRAALEHHLHKVERGDSDRDKIDFLLVQFLSVCAPSPLDDEEASHEFVAAILEPVLGKAEQTLPESLESLEGLVQAANACRSLQEVYSSGILEKGRKLKAASGNDYFAPPALVAFARFNFLMRRVFFRVMQQDLNAILGGLRELELRGVESLDCRRADFSAEEPVLRLRMICQSWKVMFQAEYSFGHPLRILVDLRAVIDAALENSNAKRSAKPDASASLPLAKAAAASGDTSATVADREPEEVELDLGDES